MLLVESEEVEVIAFNTIVLSSYLGRALSNTPIIDKRLLHLGPQGRTEVIQKKLSYE